MQAAAVVPAGGTTEAGGGAQSAQNKALATKLAEQPAAAGTLPAIAGANNPNQQAANQIRNQLRATSQLLGRKITVRYAKGTVWLQGQVPDRDHYNAVVAAVITTQGVTITQVITDGLTVDGAASQRPIGRDRSAPRTGWPTARRQCAGPALVVQCARSDVEGDRTSRPEAGHRLSAVGQPRPHRGAHRRGRPTPLRCRGTAKIAGTCRRGRSAEAGR